MLSIPDNIHTIIFGQTGTGKTVLLMWLLKQQSRRKFIFNTKGDDDFLKLPMAGESCIVISQPEDLEFLIEKQIISDWVIITPDDDNEEVNWHWYDKFNKLIFLYCKNSVVAYDELIDLHQNQRGVCGFWLNKILMQGRARKTTIIGCSQRPAGISKAFFSESKRAFCFDLQLDDDLKTAQKYLKMPAKIDLTNYKFWAYNAQNKKTAHYNAVSNPLLNKVEKYPTEISVEHLKAINEWI